MLRHCVQEDVLACPRCHAHLEPVAVLRKHDTIERILRHLALLIGPSALGPPDTIAYEVTGEGACPDERLGLRGTSRA